MTDVLALIQSEPPSAGFDVLRIFGPVSIAVVALLLLITFAALLMIFTRRRGLAEIRRADILFTAALRGSPHVLSVFQDEQRFPDSSRWQVYVAGCRELSHYLIGMDTVDRSFSARLRAAGRITPSQMNAVTRAMQFAAGTVALDLREFAATPFTGGASLPWLGLIGTIGVFVEAALRPEASGGLLMTMLAPAMVPLALAILIRLLLSTISRRHAAELEEEAGRVSLFPLEVGGMMERAFVDHRQQSHELPSLGTLGPPEMPGFNLPPPESALRAVK